jgi:hypothetical protein
VLRLSILAFILLLASDAFSDAREIPSVFLVSKTQNRNQVHYAVAVDAACRPKGAAPVRAYWRMLERGPDATAPLLDREQPAYGIARQDVEGDSVRIVLRALPARPIQIQTGQAPDGTCRSVAYITISGTRARLFNVHVACGWLCSRVVYLLLTGWTDAGAVVRERVEP